MVLGTTKALLSLLDIVKREIATSWGAIVIGGAGRKLGSDESDCSPLNECRDVYTCQHLECLMDDKRQHHMQTACMV